MRTFLTTTLIALTLQLTLAWKEECVVDERPYKPDMVFNQPFIIMQREDMENEDQCYESCCDLLQAGESCNSASYFQPNPGSSHLCVNMKCDPYDSCRWIEMNESEMNEVNYTTSAKVGLFNSTLDLNEQKLVTSKTTETWEELIEEEEKIEEEEEEEEEEMDELLNGDPDGHNVWNLGVNNEGTEGIIEGNNEGTGENNGGNSEGTGENNGGNGEGTGENNEGNNKGSEENNEGDAPFHEEQGNTGLLGEGDNGIESQENGGESEGGNENPDMGAGGYVPPPAFVDNSGIYGPNQVDDFDYATTPVIVIGVICTVLFLLIALICVGRKLTANERLKYRPLRDSFPPGNTSSLTSYHDID